MAKKPADKKNSTSNSDSSKPSASQTKSGVVIEGKAEAKAPKPATKPTRAERKAEAKKAADAKRAEAAKKKAEAQAAAQKKRNDAAAAKQAKKAARAEARKNKKGGGGLVGGVVGGALVAGLGYGAVHQGYLPINNSNELDAEQLLAAHEDYMASTNKVIAAYQTRIEALEAEQKNISEQAQTNSEPQIDIEALKAELLASSNQGVAEVATRLDEVTKQIEAGDAGEGPALAALSQSVEDIKTQLGALPSEEQLTAQVETAVSSSMESLKAQDDSEEVAERFSQVAESFNEISAVAEQNKSSLEGLSTKFEGVETQLATLGAEIEGQKNFQAQAQTALASAGFVAAVKAGLPFEGELAALEASSPELSEKLSALKPFARSGFDSGEKLHKRFDDLSNQIGALEKPQAQDVSSKFLNSFKSLVKVRPAGEIEGDSTEAVLSRMRASLEDGDFSRYSSEAKSLSEKARALFAEFDAELALRHGVEDLISVPSNANEESEAPAQAQPSEEGAAQ